MANIDSNKSLLMSLIHMTITVRNYILKPEVYVEYIQRCKYDCSKTFFMWRWATHWFIERRERFKSEQLHSIPQGNPPEHRCKLTCANVKYKILDNNIRFSACDSKIEFALIRNLASISQNDIPSMREDIKQRIRRLTYDYMSLEGELIYQNLNRMNQVDIANDRCYRSRDPSTDDEIHEITMAGSKTMYDNLRSKYAYTYENEWNARERVCNRLTPLDEITEMLELGENPLYMHTIEQYLDVMTNLGLYRSYQTFVESPASVTFDFTRNDMPEERRMRYIYNSVLAGNGSYKSNNIKDLLIAHIPNSHGIYKIRSNINKQHLVLVLSYCASIVKRALLLKLAFHGVEVYVQACLQAHRTLLDNGANLTENCDNSRKIWELDDILEKMRAYRYMRRSNGDNIVVDCTLYYQDFGEESRTIQAIDEIISSLTVDRENVCVICGQHKDSHITKEILVGDKHGRVMKLRCMLADVTKNKALSHYDRMGYLTYDVNIIVITIVLGVLMILGGSLYCLYRFAPNFERMHIDRSNVFAIEIALLAIFLSMSKSIFTRELSWNEVATRKMKVYDLLQYKVNGCNVSMQAEGVAEKLRTGQIHKYLTKENTSFIQDAAGSLRIPKCIDTRVLTLAGKMILINWNKNIIILDEWESETGIFFKPTKILKMKDASSSIVHLESEKIISEEVIVYNGRNIVA